MLSACSPSHPLLPPLQRNINLLPLNSEKKKKKELGTFAGQHPVAGHGSLLVDNSPNFSEPAPHLTISDNEIMPLSGMLQGGPQIIISDVIPTPHFLTPLAGERLSPGLGQLIF